MGVNIELELTDRYGRDLILTKDGDGRPVLSIRLPLGLGADGGVPGFELDEVAVPTLRTWLGLL